MASEDKIEMKLHTLPADPGRQQKRKRIGRGEGSGHGKTAGKGHKGKQARSGSGPGPYFEGGQMPLIRRIPKFGFKNPFRKDYEVVNLDSLEKHFDQDAVVTIEDLRAKRLVTTTKPVKVLGNGELTKKLTVHANNFSRSAVEKIEAAGGTTEISS